MIVLFIKNQSILQKIDRPRSHQRSAHCTLFGTRLLRSERTIGLAHGTRTADGDAVGR